MRQEMRVHAYDVMDKVQVVIRYSAQSGQTGEEITWETVVSTTVQGSGETDGREWVSDALIAALEAL